MTVPETFLFDLDGTLVDSIPDLTTSINQLRRELDLPAITADRVRTCVGDGVGLLVQRALPPDLFSPQRRQRFVEIYTEHLTDETYVYPGIIPFLERHRGKPMAVVTNKPQSLTERLLERLELSGYFGFVIGAENGLQRKPHPAMVVRALQALDRNPASAVMFGDHHVDLRAARAAAVRTCFCEWGFGHDDGLASDFRAASTADLASLFPAGEAR